MNFLSISGTINYISRLYHYKDHFSPSVTDVILCCKPHMLHGPHPPHCWSCMGNVLSISKSLLILVWSRGASSARARRAQAQNIAAAYFVVYSTA